LIIKQHARPFSEGGLCYNTERRRTRKANFSFSDPGRKKPLRRIEITRTEEPGGTILLFGNKTTPIAGGNFNVKVCLNLFTEAMKRRPKV